MYYQSTTREYVEFLRDENTTNDAGQTMYDLWNGPLNRIPPVLMNEASITFDGPCSIADIAEPFGVLDLSDLQGFIAAFLSQQPAADVAAPFGVWDLSDLQTFVGSFLSGCP